MDHSHGAKLARSPYVRLIDVVSLDCTCKGLLGPASRVIKRRKKKRFRGGLVFKVHRLLYHSTGGLRVIKKKKKKGRRSRSPHQQMRVRTEVGGASLLEGGRNPRTPPKWEERSYVYSTEVGGAQLSHNCVTTAD